MGEYFNLTIKEFEGRFHKTYSTLEEEEAAAKNLAAQEAQINAQNEKFDAGEANFDEELYEFLDLSDEEFILQHTGVIIDPEDEERKTTPEEMAHISNLHKKYSQEDIPEFWDSRDPVLTNSTKGWISPVKNQGGCGSCVAFATMGAAEAALIKAGADYDSVDLSEQWLLDCRKANRQCPGVGTSRYGNKVLKEQDVLMHEDDYPYTRKKNPKICPDGPYWSPGYKIDDFIFLHDSKYNTDEVMMMSIMEYGSILMSVIAQGFKAVKGGVYDIEKSGPVTHAVLGVGWGTLNGVDYWLIKNSWGKRWGDNGYIKVKRGIIKTNYQNGVFTAVRECTADSVDCTTTQAPTTTTTQAPTTTSPPCIDIWETKNCIKNKKKGGCRYSKTKQNCYKTCTGC